MNPKLVTLSAILFAIAPFVIAQQAGPAAPPAGAPPAAAPAPGGPPAAGPGGGRGGGGGGGRGGAAPQVKLVDQFDKDGNGWLNTAERQAAREFQAANARGGRGGGRGGAAAAAPAAPGQKLTQADVKSFPASVPLYDMKTLRTFFLEFENPDWEKEMITFNNTDVDVTAKLTIDGRAYRDVGVHFRGASSFMVPETFKRSLNVSIDMVHEKQDVQSYNTLNLLNAHVDPTFMRTVTYLRIAREYIPAPKANFVRVVINGESWGPYINAQQFNKDFTKEWYNEDEGHRWHVPGVPGGRAALGYLGEDPAAYKTLYSLRSKEDPKAWTALINLTKVLTETPPAQLEQALAPILDVDGALKLLALEMALINDDGIWTRASDYNIYLDTKGKFHLIPHDSNETFKVPGGGRGLAGVNGVEVSPFHAAEMPNREIITKLLAVPALRAKYVGYIRDIATKWLDWNVLGPILAEQQALIADDVAKDTHKLYPGEMFTQGVTVDVVGGGANAIGLKRFADERRAYLLRVTAPAP